MHILDVFLKKIVLKSELITNKNINDYLLSDTMDVITMLLYLVNTTET